MISRSLATLLLFSISIFSCNSTYTPKKKGYYRIDFPAHHYQSFEDTKFPYAFEYPTYARVVHDTNYLDAVADNDYWMNVDFPQYRAKFFLSYKPVGGKSILKVKVKEGVYKDSVCTNVFDRMVNDAFNLTNKNDVAATSIYDSLMLTPNGITGIYFKVGGNAATARQFFLSDTTRHFLRGALYFDATPNADSLEPVVHFLEQDMKHLITTLKWRKF
jgi:gliding motility-associated lipoprotein GldD